jgi:predicted DNA-binding transcriptional regulator YafY
VHTSATAVADHFGPTIATVTPLRDDACELVTGTDDLTELVGWLMLLGVDITVHEPHELRAAMAEVAERLARAAARGHEHPRVG